jgi:hypothetical protein
VPLKKRWMQFSAFMYNKKKNQYNPSNKIKYIERNYMKSLIPITDAFRINPNIVNIIKKDESVILEFQT